MTRSFSWKNLFPVFHLVFLTLFNLPLHAAEAPANTEHKSTLWQIKSAKNTIYLQGSIHMMKPESYPLAPAIEKALAESSSLVLEIDLDTMNNPQVQMLLLTGGMLRGGKTLDQVLTKETYDIANRIVADMKGNMAFYSPMKPWFFAMTLTIGKLQELGFSPEHGLDTYLFNKAKAAGKEIIGLETVGFQLDLFESMSTEEQDLLVRQTLEELNQMKEEIEKTTTAWRTGDEKTLAALLLKSFKNHPAIYKKIITDRNRTWLPAVESLVNRKETYMIVVGAYHLVGEDGLVQLLKNKGYTVEQL